jgi:hypothetical protein
MLPYAGAGALSTAALALAQLLGGGSGYSPTGRWLTCPDGQLGDLRPAGPLAVLTEDTPSDRLDYDSPFFTVFALYRDGRLVARRGSSLWTWRLSSPDRDRLIGSLRLDELDAVDPNPLRDVAFPAAAAPPACLDCPVVSTALHTWNGGCHRVIRLYGLSAMGWTGDVVGGRLSGYLGLATQRERLAKLPPALQQTLRQMTAARPPGGRRICKLASCFARGLQLPDQDAWLVRDQTR